MANSLTEFDAEEAYRDIREDGFEEGYSQGASQKAIEAAENLLRLNVLSYEQIAQVQGLSLEKVKEIAKNGK